MIAPLSSWRLTPADQDDSQVLGAQFIQEGYTLSYKATKPVAAIQNASCVAFELLGALSPIVHTTAEPPCQNPL